MKMSDEKNVLVATYGSLRQRMGNAHVNGYADAEYVGKGKTVGKFDLFQYCHAFPSVSLAHHDSDTQVVVDVYRTTQEGLEGPYDRLEGCRYGNLPGSFYYRYEVPVVLDSGEEVKCWIYAINEVTGPRVEHGDWCLHKNENYYGQTDL